MPKDINKDNKENKMQPKDDNKPKYSASSIRQEEGAEAHRLRPARFIGAVDGEGIFNQLMEVVDNSIDEMMDYYHGDFDKTKRHYKPIINITINDDDSVVVEDFGRGIPCEEHPETGIPAVIMVCESDSAGGKGRDTEGYSTATAGTHGAGLAVAKSLAEYMILEINSLSANGKYRLEYKEGIRQGELERVGDLELDSNGNPITGTKVTYRYDDKIFEKSRYGRKEDNAFRRGEIVKKMSDALIGQNTFIEVRFKYKNEEVEVISPKTTTPEKFLDDEDLVKISIDGSKSREPYTMDLYLSMKLNRYVGTRKTIVNRLNTTSSPTDNIIVDEVQSVLDYIIRRDKNVNKDVSSNGVTTELVRNKMSALIIMTLPTAAYSGQNKSILKSTGYSGHLRAELEREFKNSEEFLKKVYVPIREAAIRDFEIKRQQEIIAKRRERELEKQKEQKTKEEELKDIATDLRARNKAQEKSLITLKPSPMPNNKSTLVYVEGDSAGSSLNDLHRDGDVPIAIATMRGNPTNAYEEKVMSDLTRDNIAFCLSRGFKNIAFLTDGDPDGNHIKVLLAYHIWKYAPEYLKEGRVYIIPAPYGTVNVRKPTLINLYGELKIYPIGNHYTYSTKEHETLIETGAMELKIFTGLADAGDGPINSLKNPDSWIPVNKVIPEDIELLESLLEDSSDFKKSYTSLAYSGRQFYTNRVQRAKKEVEIAYGDEDKLYQKGMLTKKPNLIDYKMDIHENTLRKFGIEKW